MSDYYRFELPAIATTFEVDHMRRERHELIGELTVRCSLPGAKTTNGCLSVADFNFSALRSRKERAAFLADRARTNGKVDWFAYLEDFCQQVFQEERNGIPAMDLREMPRPQRGDEINIGGFQFPKRHPTILFGDGGAAKSYMGLFLAGHLADTMNVALFDWELCADDHRDRLERIFGKNMPKVLYCRCERPLVYEVDRLRKVIRQNQIGYAFFDSIAFACKGRPEDAEAASEYFRALREINCGSLHIAHISKALENNDKRPFGSIFWHNGARCTWYVQAAEVADETILNLGFFNRKSNLGAIKPSLSYRLRFVGENTHFERVDIASTPELAEKLSIRQRMYLLLSRGSMSLDEIADELGADVESIKRTQRRYRDTFTVLAGGRIGLLAVGQ